MHADGQLPVPEASVSAVYVRGISDRVSVESSDFGLICACMQLVIVTFLFDTCADACTAVLVHMNLVLNFQHKRRVRTNLDRNHPMRMLP